MKLHPDINYENKEMRGNTVSQLTNTFNKLPQRIQDIHKDLFLYYNFIFKSMKDKGLITCRIHGDFPQTMMNHLHYGHGCPDCAQYKINLALTKSTEDFIRKARLVHGDKYDYSLVDYKGSDTNVIIICKEHGEFPQLPGNHLSGKGCNDCATYGFKPNLPAILYYICIDELYYKIGITIHTVDKRYKAHQMKRIVKEWKYEVGRDAHTEEQRIINEFRKHLHDVNLLNEGKRNQEIFNHDILQLDN